MSLGENAGEVITLTEARELVEAFQERYPEAITSFLINAELIRNLSNQEGCVGVRIYNGYNIEKDRPSPVMIGVNERNENMTSGVILDRAIPHVPKIDDTNNLLA